jgi:catechol 2,3-dioxygenase-like lactoylglutathione lyase family enzyme
VIDHVTIRVSDREASETFYETVLRTIGVARTHTGEDFTEWSDFSLARGVSKKPVTRRLHIGFFAPSRAHVDEFWRVGTEAGYPDDGAPGARPQYRPDYYGAFLLDPDGNSAEAVHHGREGRSGVDHVWMRVADVAASKRFYETVAPHAGFRLHHDSLERASFGGPEGAFSVVAGRPSEGVHLAFKAPDDAAVDAFHRATTEAGYEDNGEPGERAIYDEGYYAAYVLDPDGNNVEVVHRNR